MIGDWEQRQKEKMVQKIYSEALLLTGNPVSVCDGIVRWISDVLDVEFAFVEKLEGEHFKVISSIQHGEMKRGDVFPVRYTPCEDVQVTKQPCMFQNVSELFPDDPFLSENNISYYCGVPIFDHEDVVIGILNALGTENREVSPDDRKLMELMAKRAGLELEHMKLEEESKTLRHNLLEIGQDILQEQNVDEILNRVVHGIRTQSPFSVVAITLYKEPIDPHEGAQEKIAKVVLGGLDEEDHSKLMEFAESGQFISAHQIVTKGRRIGGGYFVSPEMIPELIETSVEGPSQSGETQDWGPYDDFYIFLEQGDRINKGDRIIGRISFGSPISGRLPSNEELEPLNLFANLAAIALDKAQRLEELKTFHSRLEGIYKWNEQLADCENLDELSKVAVQAMIEIFNYDLVSLYRNEGSLLVLTGFDAKIPFSEFAMEKFQSIPINRGITGQAASKRMPILCKDVHEHPSYIEGHPNIRSEMAAPIVEGGELLGVLNIECTQANAFGEDDLKVLSALASQLALTMRGIEGRQEVEWINRFLKGLNRASNLEEMLKMIIQRGIDILAPKADAGSFLLWNDKSQMFEFAVAIGRRDWENVKNVKLSRQVLEEIFNEDEPVIFTGSIQEESELIATALKAVESERPASTISMPIRDGDSLIAVLSLNNLKIEGVFVDKDAERIWNLVSEIKLALSRAQDHEKLRMMATRDALTNTYNRHFFSEYVDQGREKELLKVAPISLVMVDIDDFYQVNDRFGHAEGDRVLQQVAELIRLQVRKDDMVVRYGGDEFIIIMPQTSEKQASKVMERLKAKLEDWRPDLPELSLSISFGVAIWDPNSNESLVDVLEKADEFMYHRRQERDHDRRAQKHAIIGTPRKGPNPHTE